MAFHAMLVLIGLLAVGNKQETAPRYDPATVIDVPVVVSDIRTAAGENALDGVQLVVKTDSDATLEVYLGPASFIKEFEIRFAKGDRIQVIGSKVKVAGGWLVLAREVRKNSSTLYLRGRDGAPYWQVAR